MLSVKLGNIWTGLSGDGALRVRPVAAQKATPEKPAAKGGKTSEAAGAKPEAADGKGGARPIPVEAKAGDVEPDDVSRLSHSEIRLLQELGERRKALDKRERRLNQRAALLKAAGQRLVAQQAELKKIERQIKKLLDQKDKEETQRLDRLVAIYSNMKPKDAAKIFNDLDMDVLLGVMLSMKERKIAPIVTAMDAKRARQLTRQLAERQSMPKIPK